MHEIKEHLAPLSSIYLIYMRASGTAKKEEILFSIDTEGQMNQYSTRFEVASKSLVSRNSSHMISKQALLYSSYSMDREMYLVRSKIDSTDGSHSEQL